MQAYQENISAKVNGVLTPILGVKVTVTDDSTGHPATLFSDNGITQITSDIVTDETGYFGFFAANGSYTVSFSGPQIRLAPRNIDLYDPLDDAPLTQSQAASPSGASRLGYGQRTIENKLGEFVSVKDAPFSAKGDGVVDDTAAIQAALNASIGVRFPTGTYKITAPLVLTGGHVIRADKRGATIVADPSFVAGNVTRTYVDSGGATQTLTWNDKAVFYLVCPTNSYLTDVVVDGLSFSLPADGSVGVFNAQRLAHSSFTNLFCDTSAYFAKGYDLWMIQWANIRSRFSKDHFDINTGTSNSFTNVHCDNKHSTGGTGYSFTNLFYSSMTACGADSVDRCYYFNGSGFTLNGCGAESFSRILHAVGGATLKINGGKLAVYKAASATGQFTPYQFDGTGTLVTFSGGWIGIANPASSGGGYDKLAISNGAKVAMMNTRAPVELDPVKWWYITNPASSLTLNDDAGARVYDQYGLSRYGSGSNLKSFTYTKSIPAGSAQSIFRIGATTSSAYGDSSSGRIRVHMRNDYGADLGFSGWMEFGFTAMKETTTAQNLTLMGQAFTMSNTGGAAFGGVTGTLLRNGDNTIDFQLNVANSPAVVNSTNVTVFVEYMVFNGGNVSPNEITGV